MKTAEELLRASLWGQSLTEEEMLKRCRTSERSFAAGRRDLRREAVDYGWASSMPVQRQPWDHGKTTSLTGIQHRRLDRRRLVAQERGHAATTSWRTRNPRRLLNRSTSTGAGSQHPVQPLPDRAVERTSRPIHLCMIENERSLIRRTHARAPGRPVQPGALPAPTACCNSRKRTRLPCRRLPPACNQALKVLEDAGLVRSEYGGSTCWISRAAALRRLRDTPLRASGPTSAAGCCRGRPSDDGLPTWSFMPGSDRPAGPRRAWPSSPESAVGRDRQGPDGTRRLDPFMTHLDVHQARA